MTPALSTPRVAGAALILSIVAILIGLGIAGAQGRVHGMAAGFRGVEGIGEAASVLGLLNIAAFVMIVLQLVGFTLLAVMLADAGERAVAAVALVLFVFAAATAVIEGSLQGTVTPWAGRYWERTGQVPELFEALRHWVQYGVQPVYMTAYFMAMAGFGWATVRTAVLPESVGWAALAWTALAIVLYYGLLGAPAVIVVYPLLFGGALLLL